MPETIGPTGYPVYGGTAVAAANATNLSSAISTLDSRVDDLEAGTNPIPLPSYTVATLPSVATYARCLIYVSDGASNKRLAVSDGTNWRFPDGAIVS